VQHCNCAPGFDLSCLQPSVSQLHSDNSLCVCVQHCNCPPWFNLSCLQLSVSQLHSDNSLCVCVHLQHCNCPPGFNLSCPDNGTAPGCITLPDIPSRSRILRTTGVVVALLVVVLGWAICSTPLMADVCRLCLGAGNPLGECRGLLCVCVLHLTL